MGPPFWDMYGRIIFASVLMYILTYYSYKLLWTLISSPYTPRRRAGSPPKSH